mgnify:CR=1 FL=1
MNIPGLHGTHVLVHQSTGFPLSSGLTEVWEQDPSAEVWVDHHAAAAKRRELEEHQRSLGHQQIEVDLQ